MTLPATIRKWNHTYYQCLNKCGNYVRVKNGLCQSCYIKVRQAKAEYHNPTRKRKKYVYPCRNGCGNTTTKIGSRCKECYRKEANVNPQTSKILKDKMGHPLYPCKRCKALIRKQDSLCHKCFDTVLRNAGEVRYREDKQRKEEVVKRQQQNYKPDVNAICLKSPTKAHYEIIDSDKIGTCKYCGRTKDYNVLLGEVMKEVIK